MRNADPTRQQFTVGRAVDPHVSTAQMLKALCALGCSWILAYVLLRGVPLPTFDLTTLWRSIICIAAIMCLSYYDVTIEAKTKRIAMSLGDIAVLMTVLVVNPWLAIFLKQFAHGLLRILDRRGLDAFIVNLSIAVVEMSVAAAVLHRLAPGEAITSASWLGGAVAINVLSPVVVTFALFFIGWQANDIRGTFSWTPYWIQQATAIVAAICAPALAYIMVHQPPAAVLIVGCLYALGSTTSFRTLTARRTAALNEFRAKTQHHDCSEGELMTTLAECSIRITGAERALVTLREGADPELTEVKRRPRFNTAAWRRGATPIPRVALSHTFSCRPDRYAQLQIEKYQGDTGTFSEFEVNLLRPLMGFAAARWGALELLQQTRHEAHRDELTGIANIKGLLARLEEGPRDGLLICVGVGNTQAITSAFGIDVVDQICQSVSLRLQHICQRFNNPTVAAVGRGVFAIWLPAGKADDLDVVAHACDDISLDQHLTVDVRIRSGWTVVDDDTPDATLVQQALAAYNQAVLTDSIEPTPYTNEELIAAQRRFKLATDLRAALRCGAIQAFYQPKVNAHSGRYEGAEALARWEHPSLGFIPPDQFVDIARQSDQMLDLTTYMLEAACRECAQWQTIVPDAQISVNVAASDIAHPGFPEIVRGVLARTGLAPRLLSLELTETDMISDISRVLDAMAAIKRTGVSLSIDDFGTGYSSLSYLRNLPVDEVKIDRSFIMSLGTDRQSTDVVQHIIGMLHSLQLRVVAEGVETIEGQQLLREFDCDVLQGYLISRPLPSTKLRPWLDDYTGAGFTSAAAPQRPAATTE